jgi:hypothetical protein
MPKPAVHKIDLRYPQLRDILGDHVKIQPTESRALLAWFLENYYHFDDLDISECICDRPHDKGIDGVYANDQLNQIDIFSSVLVKKDQAMGSADLREFAGSLTQFNTATRIKRMINSAQISGELVSVINSQDVIRKIADGYTLRGIFVTNGALNADGQDFLDTQENLTIFDKVKLNEHYIPLDRPGPINAPVVFDISDTDVFTHKIRSGVRMHIVPLKATELLKMAGISSQELFYSNVRQYLGPKTKVNTDIATSICDQKEHQFFPLFHNGITILCDDISTLHPSSTSITLTGYAVVNGCQSLVSVFENKSSISPELRILTKIIKVRTDSKLASKITDHTNNQNGVRTRDLYSNTTTQIRLQIDIARKFDGMSYRIKTGEHQEWEKDKTIENELAARMILAADLREPWSCHLKTRLFDEWHNRLFNRPDVNAEKIVFLHDMYKAASQAVMDYCENRAMASYVMTNFLVMYLVAEAMSGEASGAKIIANPAKYMRVPSQRAHLLSCMSQLAIDLVKFLNNFLKSLPQPFDHRTNLRNSDRIKEIRAGVIGNYQVLTGHTASVSFSSSWEMGAMR